MIRDTVAEWRKLFESNDFEYTKHLVAIEVVATEKEAR